MSGEEIELNDLDYRRRQEEEENEEEKTDLGGGSDDNDLLDNIDWLSNRGRDVKHSDPLKKLFRDRVNEARNIGSFIEDVLFMEKDCTNPRFVNYLMEKQDFTIKKTISVSGPVSNVEIEYYGEPFFNENDVRVRLVIRFKTTDGVIADPN